MIKLSRLNLKYNLKCTFIKHDKRLKQKKNVKMTFKSVLKCAKKES